MDQKSDGQNSHHRSVNTPSHMSPDRVAPCDAVRMSLFIFN
jgi:hypothetical protein